MNITKKISDPSSKSLRKSLSIKVYRNSKVLDFNYIWQSSIPESWNRIIEKKNIIPLQLHKNSRDTLGFLEETQKYISRICSPKEVSESGIPPSFTQFPSKKRKTLFQSRSDNSILSPKTKNPKHPSFKSRVMKNRLVLSKKKSKTEIPSPIITYPYYSLPDIRSLNIKK
jgi:hypothetical protein